MVLTCPLLLLAGKLLYRRLQLVELEVVDVVSLVLVHQELSELQVVVTLVQDLLLEILLFEFLGLLLVVLLLWSEYALAQSVSHIILY